MKRAVGLELRPEIVDCAVRVGPDWLGADRDLGVAKPALVGGEPALVVELVDVYDDTRDLARRCLDRALAGAAAAVEAESCEVAGLVDRLYACGALEAGPAADWGEFHSVPCGGAPLRLGATGGLLVLSRPPVPVPAAAWPILRRWALRLNAGVRLVQAAVRPAGLELSVRLPLEGLRADRQASLLAAAALSVRVLLAVERTLPPLAVFADPIVLRGLELAEEPGSAAGISSSSSLPEVAVT